MLKKRIIVALWGIPLLVAAAWFEQLLPWFTVLIAAWGLLAAFEFYRMVAFSRVQPLTWFGLLFTLLFILRPHFSYDFFIPLLLTSLVVLPLIWLILRKLKENAVAAWVWTIAGILYVGWLLSYLVELRMLDNGRNWVFLAFFATFASDTSAFFIGRAIGKHKLAPNISPGKTWEGAIGGILGAVILSLLFVLPSPFSLPLSWFQAVLIGFLISVFGQFGDLVESLFKRNMGVKDSGTLLAGHGGFLDRIDSIVFAGVLVYYFAVWTIL